MRACCWPPKQYGCVKKAALIAALTQGRAILIRNVDKRTRENRADLLGDHDRPDFFMLMKAWHYAHRSNYNLNRCRRLGIHAGAARQVKPLYDSFLRTCA